MLRRHALATLVLLLPLVLIPLPGRAGEGIELKLARELLLAPAASVPPTSPLPPAPTPSAPSLSPDGLTILAAALIFLLANIAGLLAASVAMRIWREREERRRRQFRARWEPVLHARMAGDSIPLPALAPAERILFLGLWLHLFSYVRGEAAEALIQTAGELHLEPYALELLNARAPWKRLVAMRTAAALRLKAACDLLFATAARSRPRSSLYAVRALLEIDPERGVVALAHLLNHIEWSPGAMLDVAKAADAQAGPMLVAQLRAAPPGGAKQPVRLIELLGYSAALPALRERLRSNPDEGETAVILHCLGKLGGADDRQVALGMLHHTSWVVRLQAAHALGALGLAEDAERLAPLLRDRHWWVRYRSAQSLLRLAGAGAIERMRAQESDPYAREIVQRVLAEGG